MLIMKMIEPGGIRALFVWKGENMSLISNSGHDENGGYRGGEAGDQTGTEWYLRSWYDRPWNCVIRHPNSKVRELIAELAVKAAKNDKIGYDQDERVTYWSQLKKVGYDPSKITVPCEEDCSAGVMANVKAVGYLLGIEALKNVPITSTWYMRDTLKNAGFEILTASKYLKSPDYLKRGDVLLNDAKHTATNVEDGKYVGESTGTSSGTGGKITVNASMPILKKGMTGSAVRVWQQILCAAGYNTAVDSSFGDDTEEKTEKLEKAKGITKDPNQVGPAAWKAGLEILEAEKTF